MFFDTIFNAGFLLFDFLKTRTPLCLYLFLKPVETVRILNGQDEAFNIILTMLLILFQFQCEPDLAAFKVFGFESNRSSQSKHTHIVTPLNAPYFFQAFFYSNADNHIGQF